MNDDRTADDLTKLISRIKQEAYEAGRLESQAQVQDLRDELEKLLARFDGLLIDAAPKRTRSPRVAPPVNLIPQVRSAVAELAQSRPDGSDPRMITERLQANGHPFDIGQTRLALRQLTLEGLVLRIARGRYLPGPINALAAE